MPNKVRTNKLTVYRGLLLMAMSAMSAKYVPISIVLLNSFLSRSIFESEFVIVPGIGKRYDEKSH